MKEGGRTDLHRVCNSYFLGIRKPQLDFEKRVVIALLRDLYSLYFFQL
jgi:hypothetical protein